jgi:RNA polymerase sigma factor (sigma-70 family)
VQLYLRHFDRVRLFTAARLGPEDGADALMDTFAAALGSLHRFDPSWDSALPWLLGIAERMVRRHRRREALRLRTLAWLPTARDHDRWAEVDDRLDAPATLRVLGRAIRDLPEAQRQVLVLRVVGGLDYDQIARMLGVAPGTVASRLKRARDRLGVCVPPAGADERVGDGVDG